ncbi:MAG: 4Fe-4S dicluster domain-containing protein [Polyangiaceae bacterium]|nr:4Fe-4S dicluster domain-containing protein [Polyangiaceae bacterium]
MRNSSDGTAVYDKLALRIDKTQSGLAPAPEVRGILSHLFSEEEASIAVRLPITPRRLGTIVRRTGIPEGELVPKLDRMACKGLVFDFTHPTKGTYYMLAPPIVGFFEMSMMRVRSDINQPELARLLSMYMYDRPQFMREAMSGRTPIGRTLVSESAIAASWSSDVLDYERATAIVDDAKEMAISLCYCRHKKSHLGEACGAPQDVCMQLGRAAEFTVRRGLSRWADKSELREKLAQSREQGLVQIVDNVKNEPAYLCNCCGCCCGQLVAINRHGIEHAVGTSNYLAGVDVQTCTGCGKCSRACPVQAIALHARAPVDRVRTHRKMCARVDESVCLGCGVCVSPCKSGAMRMQPRQKRVLTPEDTLERVLRMQVGRGHLHDVLFDEEDGPTAAFLNRLAGAVERLPVARRAMLNETLKSRFVGFLCNKAKGTGPSVGET